MTCTQDLQQLQHVSCRDEMAHIDFTAIYWTLQSPHLLNMNYDRVILIDYTSLMDLSGIHCDSSPLLT